MASELPPASSFCICRSLTSAHLQMILRGAIVTGVVAVALKKLRVKKSDEVTLAKAERSHANRYQKALDALVD